MPKEGSFTFFFHELFQTVLQKTLDTMVKIVAVKELKGRNDILAFKDRVYDILQSNKSRYN